MTPEKYATNQDDGEMTELGFRLMAMVGMALAKAVDCQYLTMESTALSPEIIRRTVALSEVIREAITISASDDEFTTDQIDPLWEFLQDYVDFCNENPVDQEPHYVQ